MQLKEVVTTLMREGKTDQAICQLQQLLENPSANNDHTPLDELHYLLGNAYYKKGNWKEAIQHYLEACDINAESPAQQKLEMTYKILEYYNKDVFGQ